MTNQEIQEAVESAVKTGNWIIRADNDGVSHNGFKWSGIGEWTESPDWNEEPECGGGLHGQDANHGGYIKGTRLVFCDTEGKHVPIGSDKIKVRRARILLINELPELPACKELDVSDTNITELPELPACESLDVHGTKITELPELPANCRIYR